MWKAGVENTIIATGKEDEQLVAYWKQKNTTDEFTRFSNDFVYVKSNLWEVKHTFNTSGYYMIKVENETKKLRKYGYINVTDDIENSIADAVWNKELG